MTAGGVSRWLQAGWRLALAALLIGVSPVRAQGVETGAGRLIGTGFLIGMAVLVLMLMPRFRGGRRERRESRRRTGRQADSAGTAATRRRVAAETEDERAAAARRGMHVDERH